MGKDEDFVLSKVFSTLSNIDLLRASSVCKNWFNICLDPVFEWAKILTCSAECPDVKVQCESRVAQIIKLDSISYIVEDIKGKLGRLTIHPISGGVFDWCVDAAFLADIYPKLWKCTASAVHSGEGTRVCITAELNVKEFHRIKDTDDDGRRESETILANCLQWKADRILSLNHWGVVKPQNYYGELRKIESPIGVNLYDYQREALSWMLSIEEKTANNKKFRGVELDCIRVPHQPPILFSRRYQRFVDIQDALPYLPFLSPKGGFLLDDYGLGKTMEILSLILSNPIPFSQVNRKFKVASFGEFPQVSTFLYASKATLIACPSLIVQQWKREVTKRTSHSFKVIALDTLKDINQVTYIDIQSADVVIVSFSLLNNPAYSFMGLEYLQSPPSQRASAANINPFVLQDSSLRTAHLARLLSGLKKESEMGLHHKNPILELFYFHRIVIDEAHMLSDEKLLKGIGMLTASNWWVVSSTPVDPSSTRLKLASYMGLLEGMDKRYCDSMLHDFFIWRNTRYNSEVSEHLPEVNTHVVLIPKFLNETERLMYEMMEVKAEKKKDLFCSTPFLKKHNESLTQWHNSTIMELFDELIRSLAYIKKNETATEKFKKKHQKLALTLTSNFLSPTDRKSTERKNSTIVEQKDKHEKMVVHYGTVFSEVLWQYSVLQSAKKEQVSDFNSYNILEPVSDRIVKKNNSNPIPRKKTKTKMVIDQMEEEILQKYAATADRFRGTPNDLMLHLVNIYGTKLTYFLIHLRNVWAQDPNAKVMVFSQHHEALNTVSAHLKKCGVASIIITEASHQNDEKLENYIENEHLRVLLSDYSSKNTGVTITNCSDIVFLDPINSKNKIQALELERLAIAKTQRIGQFNEINLVKFVMSNCVEHELFLAIHPEHKSTCNNRNSIALMPPQAPASPNTFLESQSHLKDLVEKYNSPKKERKLISSGGAMSTMSPRKERRLFSSGGAMN